MIWKITFRTNDNVDLADIHTAYVHAADSTDATRIWNEYLEPHNYRIASIRPVRKVPLEVRDWQIMYSGLECPETPRYTQYITSKGARAHLPQ